MYHAITILDGRITARLESDVPITADLLNGGRLAGHGIQEISAESQYEEGYQVAEYTPDGTLRPLLERINDGLAVVPDGYSLVNGQLVANQPTDAPPDNIPSATDLLNILLGGAI